MVRTPSVMTGYGGTTGYGNPLLVIQGLISGAGVLTSAITAPLTAKQQRLAAEAAARGTGYNAQAAQFLALSQSQQAAGVEAGKTTRVLYGVGGVALIAILGLAALMLRK